MMSSSEMMGERRAVKVGDVQSQAPEPENLQCPRCESTNTKFCYYNNYNLSQPRYFCKACRRYWTRGGSLRNIPVGGGTRKNSKRSRSSTSPATSHSHSQPLLPAPAAPNDSPANHTNNSPVSFAVKTESTNQNQNPAPALSPFRCTDMNLNEAHPGSFSSLLGSQQTSGFLGLGGYSLGLGPGSSSGFDMLGFGFGKSAGEWPAMVEIGGENVNGGGSGGVGGSSGGSSSGCNTWQMDGVDGGALTDAGDCFGWPDLAISTPGTAGLE